MKTNDLVTVLSTNIEPADRRVVDRSLNLGLAGATVAALGAITVGFGVRPDLMTARAAVFFLLKLTFALLTVRIASVYLQRLARPGGERRTSFIAAALPFAAIVLPAVIVLGFAPSSHWNNMVMGHDWLECALLIPITAIVPFGIVVAALRSAAPTKLSETGAFAGLTAGGVSALAYALHCTDDSLPFVAVWYGGAILFCTSARAIFGPRVLRW
jgi:hypothetical protein